jgi:hypothetical protein
MGRPQKESSRNRMNITLAAETARFLKNLSNSTYIPMSNFLDMMIAEYARNHYEELKKKGLEL